MPNPTPWAALAKTLGVSAQSVAAWRRLADAPETPDVEAWRAFRASRLLGKDTATKTLAELKAELMREQIALAKNKNAKAAGEVIDREVVESMLALLGQKLDLLLRLKLEVELGPRVAGKSAAEANVEGGQLLDEIREVIESNIANFQREALNDQREDAD